MKNMHRQKLMSILALSELKDIKRHWGYSVDNFDFNYLRKPEVGMVMAVGRVGSTGEPFNIGEITVTRCALKLDCGIVGVGYLRGRNEEHATIPSYWKKKTTNRCFPSICWRWKLATV